MSTISILGSNLYLTLSSTLTPLIVFTTSAFATPVALSPSPSPSQQKQEVEVRFPADKLEGLTETKSSKELTKTQIRFRQLYDAPYKNQKAEASVELEKGVVKRDKTTELIRERRSKCKAHQELRELDPDGRLMSERWGWS